MTKRKNSSQAYHDRIAGKYDAIYENEAYWKVYNEITWIHLRRFLPSSVTARILDVGCGTGAWGLKLAKSGFAVTLTDNSEGMLEHARKKAERLGLIDRVRLIRSDLEDLKELPDDHYQFVIAQGDPLSLVSNATKAVAGLYRVTAPGSPLVCSVDNRWAGIDHYVKAKDFKALTSFIQKGDTHWLTDDESERFPIHMFWPDELRRLFEKQGFQVVEVLPKMCLFRDRDNQLLSDPTLRKKIVALELKSAHLAGALGRAAHLQIVAIKH